MLIGKELDTSFRGNERMIAGDTCNKYAQEYFPAAMQAAAHALTQQFLAWIAETPRSYAEAEAWRRSCPHLSIWEDAIADGLIRFESGAGMQGARLVLTAQERRRLGSG